MWREGNLGGEVFCEWKMLVEGCEVGATSRYGSVFNDFFCHGVRRANVEIKGGWSGD